ncbi:MAG: hypothetical protein ACM32J_04795 [Rhizobacter sp.]|jgi:hypothetical protein
MSGALNSVMGGIGGAGGGGLLSSIGGIVGSIFGGPIGGMIGSAVGNLLQDAVGSAVNDAAQTLHKEDGMPKFLVNQVKDVVKEALAESKNKDVDAATEHEAKGRVGDKFDNFTQQLTKAIIEAVRESIKNQNEQDDGSSKPSKGGKTSSGSWMVAIAHAMGKVMGEKASNLVKLSGEIANNKPKGSSDEAKQEAAAEMQRLNAEFSATSQEFNLLQNSFNTAMKTIGEGMSSVARKQ